MTADPRREIFERVFDDLERQHSAFNSFTEVMPLQDVSDADLRRAWECFRAGWNACAEMPSRGLVEAAKMRNGLGGTSCVGHVRHTPATECTSGGHVFRTVSANATVSFASDHRCLCGAIPYAEAGEFTAS